MQVDGKVFELVPQTYEERVDGGPCGGCYGSSGIRTSEGNYFCLDFGPGCYESEENRQKVWKEKQ